MRNKWLILTISSLLLVSLFLSSCSSDEGIGGDWRPGGLFRITNVESMIKSTVIGKAAIITWITDVPSTSQVEYGPTIDYGWATMPDDGLITEHSAVITRPDYNATYHFRVKSRDSFGIEKVSADHTFIVVSSIEISDVNVIPSHDSATITWVTNIPAYTQIEYGLTGGYIRHIGSGGMTTNHTFTLDGLRADSIYLFRVISNVRDDYATSEDATFTTYGDPALLDINPKIVFVSERDGNPEIYIMNDKGSDQINLTNRPDSEEGQPSCSPDGSKIAFVSDRDGESDIYMMDIDGSNQINLTNRQDIDDYNPEWSPDGTKIVFASDESRNSDICIINADGTGKINLTNNPDSRDSSPVWSPDGSKIAYESEFEILVMDADGSNIINLTENINGRNKYPTWSPDSRKIAFISDCDGEDNYVFDLFVMNADGSNQVNLTNRPESTYYTPAWSPDGSKIVYMYREIKGGDRDIYVMHSDGTNQTNANNNPNSGEYSPTWAS